MSQTGFDLLSPNILLFVDFHSLVKLKQLCKFYQKSVDDESKSLGYWPAVCNSFCYYGGIFSPVIFNPEFIYPINYRKHFFEDLWPQRSKWATLSEDGHHIIPSTQAYKVRVACRFRPGETQEGRVCLPLHQFLKLKRQQKLKQQQEVTEILVGEKDPEEFLDPFLGSLMKDPVLLKTSNRVCDRSVALQCILRGGRDPFNNRKLSQAMLEPLPELANRIREWKAKADERKDVSVDINETKSLVDASGFNNDLLEALLEIESIHRTMKKIKEQESSDLGFSNHDNFEAPLAGVNEPLEPQNEMPAPNEIVGVGLDGGDEFIAEVENTEPNFFGLNGNAHITSTSSQEDQLPGKKAERARVTDVNHQQGFVSMHIPGAGIRPFHYSQVYPTTTKQLEIYEASVKESVHSVLNGCNSCVMCYGQTGSGKTFTFLGPEGCLENLQGEDRDLANIFTQYPTLGLVLRTTDDLFLAKDHFEKYQITMNIGIQMIEVYDEKTTDLLTGRPVTVRRDTGNVNGPIVFVQNQSEFLQYLKTAHANQRYAETAMNQRSSRAHTVFLFHITQQFTPNSSSSSTHGKPLLLQSQLHLVDLAGSERVKRSRVTGIHLREAVGINSSLLVLGKVISALVKGRSHVPYLESKLTTILKSAFGGNSRTTVIINTRIEGEHGDETLQTLRFGERCAMISNTLKQLASSYEDTLSILDQSLEALNKQILAFQSKEKTQLAAYRTLLESFSNLTRKREELLLLKKEQDLGGSIENLKDSMI